MCRAAPPLTQYRPRPRTTQTTVTSLPGQTGCWAGGKGATCLRGSRRALPCVAVTSSALPSPAALSSPSQPGASPRSLRPAAGRRTLLCYVHPSAPMSALRSPTVFFIGIILNFIFIREYCVWCNRACIKADTCHN